MVEKNWARKSCDNIIMHWLSANLCLRFINLPPFILCLCLSYSSAFPPTPKHIFPRISPIPPPPRTSSCARWILRRPIDCFELTPDRINGRIQRSASSRNPSIYFCSAKLGHLFVSDQTPARSIRRRWRAPRRLSALSVTRQRLRCGEAALPALGYGSLSPDQSIRFRSVKFQLINSLGSRSLLQSLCNACGIKHRKRSRGLLGSENRVSKKSSEDGNSSRGKQRWELREEEEAAILLMALSCGSVSAWAKATERTEPIFRALSVISFFCSFRRSESSIDQKTEAVHETLLKMNLNWIVFRHWTQTLLYLSISPFMVLLFLLVSMICRWRIIPS